MDKEDLAAKKAQKTQNGEGKKCSVFSNQYSVNTKKENGEEEKMSKIRITKEGWAFVRVGKGKYHIAHNTDKKIVQRCGQGIKGLEEDVTVNGPLSNTVEKSQVCKRCLHLSKAWEYVDAAPDKTGITSTGTVFIGTTPDNAMGANRKEETKSIYVDRKLLENPHFEVELLKVSLDRRDRKLRENRKEVERLKSERRWADGEIDRLKKALAELKVYRAATGEHTVENVEAIMKAVPKAEDLEGLQLEVSHSIYDMALAMVCDITLKARPIVEWIENGDITDEMVVAAGGRVPCEVRHSDDSRWFKDSVLVCVTRNQEPFTVVVNGCRGKWEQCRVKKSDLAKEN